MRVSVRVPSVGKFVIKVTFKNKRGQSKILMTMTTTTNMTAIATIMTTSKTIKTMTMADNNIKGNSETAKINFDLGNESAKILKRVSRNI